MHSKDVINKESTERDFNVLTKLSEKIITPRKIWENIYHEDVDFGVSMLFGQPGFGRTTLALQIAGEVAKSGTVLWFSLEKTREWIENRLEELNISNKKIVINDTICFNGDKVVSFANQYSEVSLIVIDNMKLIGENINSLYTIYEKCKIPVLALCRLFRFSEDNPNHRVTYDDIIWEIYNIQDKYLMRELEKAKNPPITYTLSRAFFTARKLKGIKKYCINRNHKRDTGTRQGEDFDYDISKKTIIEEYDSDGLANEYKLLWDEKECMFK